MRNNRKPKRIINGKSRVRSWYIWRYPTDELGEDINWSITFYDVFECLKLGGNVYRLLGVEDSIDSIVRERVFEQLSELMHCEYDYIYQQWLHNHKCKTPVTNMANLRFEDE